MKKLVLACITALFLFACQQKPEEENRKTIICGKVNSFDKVKDDKGIKIMQRDILKSIINHSVEIDENGDFFLELMLDYPAELLFRYTAGISCFVYPGDSLFITIDGNCKLTKTKKLAEELEFYQIFSTSQKMFDDVFQYRLFYGDSIFNYRALDSAIQNSTPKEYKEYMASYFKGVDEKMKGFHDWNNSSQQFKDWITTELKFEKWNNLMRYWWLHARATQKDLKDYYQSMPNEYYSFLDSWKPSDVSNLLSPSYYDFLEEFFVYQYQGVIYQNKEFIDSIYKTNFELYLTTIVNKLRQDEDSYKADYLVARTFSNYLTNKEYNKIKNSFDSTIISDSYLRGMIVQQYKYEKDLYENPLFAPGSNLNQLARENNYLQELIKLYPDKVLYLDFWAPWCGPCMQEMPNAKLVKNKMAGKDVVFVYLANRCSEDSWKATIAEKKIEGEHFFLNDKQYAHLSQIFGVRGIPHFAIIDKQGNIAEQRAPRPSSGDKLVMMLESYL